MPSDNPDKPTEGSQAAPAPPETAVEKANRGYKKSAAAVVNFSKLLAALFAIVTILVAGYRIFFKEEVDRFFRAEIVRLLAGPSDAGLQFIETLNTDRPDFSARHNFIAALLQNSEQIALWEEQFAANRSQIDTVTAFSLRRIVNRLTDEDGRPLYDADGMRLYEEIERHERQSVFLSVSESFRLYVIPEQRYVPPLCSGSDCRGHMIEHDQATFSLQIGTNRVNLPRGNRINGEDITCEVHDAIEQFPTRMVDFQILPEQINPDFEYDFNIVIISSKEEGEECA